MKNFGFESMTGTCLESTTTVSERAGRWFLSSGIQHSDGGVARYYRSDVHQNALVSTEITGYAVSFLLYLHELTGLQRYREAALRAARFLVHTAWDAALDVFPFEHPSNSTASNRLAYFFDSGIIVRGLLSTWRATRENYFLDTALRAGQGMLLHFRAPSALHPILSLPQCQPLEYGERWSARPGCYQLKSAMAWQDLYEATGDAEMLAAYDAALETALATHETFLREEPDPLKVMDRLHAYAYFLEGMLPRAMDSVCAGALSSGIGCIASRAAGIAPSFARSDVFAQLLRLRLFASALGVVALDRAAATREAAAVAAFQLESSDSRIDGAFGFGTRCGQMMPFVNPVSTAFGVQALSMWQQYQEHCLQPDLRALI